MTGFVIAALALALLAALFLALPLLRSRGAIAPAVLAAMVALFVLLGGSAIGYSLLGSRTWTQSDPNAANRTAISTLARHLESEPTDQAGWLQLGAAYSNIQQYSLATRSYERANRLANGTNAAALAGMGESMLLSGDAAQQPQAMEFFERALVIDSKLPKALFYTAVAAYRDGRLQVARDRFAAMLALTPAPPENVRVLLQKQIDDIDAQLHPKVDEASAIHLHLTIDSALTAKIPANSTLFVFVRSPQGGAPLAVKRLTPTLPQDVVLSSADAMIAGSGVKPGQEVSVVARISASGAPLAQSGDLFGELQTVAGKKSTAALEIGKVSP